MSNNILHNNAFSKNYTMNIIIKQLELIQRIDQLIRFKATGSAPELAIKLGISRTKLYRMIAIMKELNAPVVFDEALQSYVYNEEVGLAFGFYKKKRSENEIQQILC